METIKGRENLWDTRAGTISKGAKPFFEKNEGWRLFSTKSRGEDSYFFEKIKGAKTIWILTGPLQKEASELTPASHGTG